MMSPPVPLAFLICDHVWRDPRSGQHCLLGTLSTIASSEFPATIDMAVYFALIEGRGKQAIRVELVDIDEERPPVFQVDAELMFNDPREVVEGAFQFTGLVLPEPGEYRLKLFVAHEFLMERSLHITAAVGQRGE